MILDFFANKYRAVSKKKIARIVLAVKVEIALLLLAIMLLILYLQ